MKISKSQVYISNALIELMREKPFEKISVKAVAERAFVSRASFYNHFAGVRELLDDMLRRAVESYFTGISGQAELESLRAMSALSLMVSDRLELLRVLDEQGLLQLVPRTIADVLGVDGHDRLGLYHIDALFYSAYFILANVPGLSAEDTAQTLLENRGLGVCGDLSVLSGAAPRSADPRGRETVRLLRQAMKKLSREKAVSNISISELTREAGVARCSFYRHYRTVEHFLYCALEDCFIQALGQQRPAALPQLLDFYCDTLTGLLDTALPSGKANCFRLLSGLLLRQTEAIYDDIPWKEQLLEHSRCWCFAVRHVCAVYAFFPVRAVVPAREFSALL